MASKQPKKRPIPVPRQAATGENAPEIPASAGTGRLSLSLSLEPKWILVAILIVGALLRGAYLLSIQSNPDYNVPTSDAAYKDFWAHAILTGDASPAPGQPDPQLATSPYVRPPTYPFFMAFVYLLTGYSFTALRLVQMALGLLSCFFLYRIARRVFAESISLLAAFLMSTYWVFVFFEGEMNSPPLIVFCILTIMDLMLMWTEDGRIQRLIWSGLLFGVLVLDRPETLLFLPVLLAWGFFAGPAAPMGKRLLHLAIVPAVVALCIAPVTLRNYLKSGEPVLICTIGGLNLYAGNGPDATGYFPNIDFQQLFGVAQGLSHQNFPQLVQALERKTGQEHLTQSDLQSFFVSEALKYMRENPMHVLLLDLKKAAYFWGPHEISSDKVFELEKRNNPILHYMPPFAAFMSLAVVGLVLLIAGRYLPAFREGLRPGAWRALSLIGAFVLVSFLTHLIFFVVARFRVPVVPFVLLLAAFALYHGVAALLRRDNALLGFWGAALIVSALVFGIGWVPYEADAVMYHFQRGLVYGHIGDTTDAIKEFQASVASGGDKSADVCSEFGYGLSLQGEIDNALHWYDEAIKLDPKHVLSLQRKGDALLIRGELTDAADAYRRAVAADFTNVPARLGLVRSLVRMGGFDEAQSVANETIALGLGEYEGHMMLGELAGYQGRHDEAVEHFNQAVALRPEDADVQNLLGLEYAAMGKFDDAIAAYQKAIKLRPGFALAYTNLGNLYADQKDYDKAIIQYTDALTANPLEPGAEYGWGYVNAQRGEIDKAIFRMNNALAKRPSYMEAHNYIGYLYLQQGKTDEARFHLERAVRLAPNFIPAHNNLGDLYVKLGMLDEAEAQYRAVLQLQPGEPYAMQQLQAVTEQRVRKQLNVSPDVKMLVVPGSS